MVGGGDEQEEGGDEKHLRVQPLSSLGSCSTILFLADLLPPNSYVLTREAGILKIISVSSLSLVSCPQRIQSTSAGASSCWQTLSNPEHVNYPQQAE